MVEFLCFLYFLPKASVKPILSTLELFLKCLFISSPTARTRMWVRYINLYILIDSELVSQSSLLPFIPAAPILKSILHLPLDGVLDRSGHATLSFSSLEIFSGILSLWYSPLSTIWSPPTFHVHSVSVNINLNIKCHSHLTFKTTVLADLLMPIWDPERLAS